MNKIMNEIIRVVVAAICYAGILLISNIDVNSKEYWIITLLLIIQSFAWGIK